MLEPRWYQTEANASVWQYLRSHPTGNPVVVLPTGSGKSLVIAMMIQQAIVFGGRVVVLAHRKELLQQNADEIRQLIPGCDVGTYSAGLNKQDVHNQVVVAGIQSVFRKAADLGRRHLILVDECHLISDLEESMYGQFLGEMQLQKGLRIAGLTATPFRTGSGPICGRKKMFQDIVFEAKTSQLITEGYLCPITNKVADNAVNTDRVGIRGGEFIESEMQAAFAQDKGVVVLACNEIYEKCRDRHSILIFASGVSHAEDVATILEQMTGERVGVVTGGTMDIERGALLADFKNQKLRWLVNCDVLTTGFNARCIDAIAVLRATLSPGLFCQMIGRGLRTHESKLEGCRILDFGGNIARHGSIDDDNYGYSDAGKQGTKRHQDTAGNGRGKRCPNCELDVAANSRTCPECDFEFAVRHDATADNESQLTGKPEPEEWIVAETFWKRHDKKPTAENPEPKPTVRVDYVVRKADEPNGNLASKTISEWICPEHSKFARLQFIRWWNARSTMDAPDTVEDSLFLLSVGACRHPVRITTVKEGKYTPIKSCDFGDVQKPTELKEVQAKPEVFSGEGDDVPF